MERQSRLTEKSKQSIESKVFNRLISHLQKRTDVQNIDLMNLSGFCRNCLSNWYKEEAGELGINIDKDLSREIVYGMPHKKWKEKYQKEASSEKLEKFKEQKD